MKKLENLILNFYTKKNSLKKINNLDEIKKGLYFIPHDHVFNENEFVFCLLKINDFEFEDNKIKILKGNYNFGYYKKGEIINNNLKHEILWYLNKKLNHEMFYYIKNKELKNKDFYRI